MAAGYLLYALVGLQGLFFVSALSMTWAARGVGRLLGIANFQWFDPRPAPVAWWRWLLVRVATMAAPLVVSITLFWLSIYLGGVQQLTGTRVEVNSGPAATAGLRTGDRVLRVGDEPIRDFDELRAAVKRSRGTVAIEVERDGHPLVLDVTPQYGKIGVTLLPQTERLSLLAAAARALPMPFGVVQSTLREVARSTSRLDRADLRGPVGIVRETSRSAQQSGSAFLWMLAALGGHWWPFAGAVVLFEAVTGAIFRAAHPEAASSSLRGYRLERLRQATLFSCAGYATFIFAAGFDTAGVPFARLVMLGAMATGAAGYPLIWLAGKELWGRSSTALVLLAALLVPCLLLIIVLAVHFRLGRALKNEGFLVSWLSAQLPLQPSEPTRWET